MTTLLLSSRHTEDNQLIWQAATRRGWNVERAIGIRVPEFDDNEVVLYLESLFAPTVAKQLGLRLLTTPDDWLAQLPADYRQRNVTLSSIESAKAGPFPAFIKPPNEKSFEARVYNSPNELPTDYDPDTPVLVVTPVSWAVEFRCFCLDGTVRTLSPYLRSGKLARLDGFIASDEELASAKAFAERVLSSKDVSIPRSIVLDVGIIQNVGWAVVEANGAWGSGIYGCHPDTVLDVIQHAVERLHDPLNQVH